MSHRYVSLSLAALLALASSSCLFSGAGESEKALKAQPSPDLAPVLRAQAPEPEYVEGEFPPEFPPARAEERPSAPSTDHVWVAGHHTRRDGEWVWVGGRWSLPPRSGVVWVPGHWVSHLHGHAWISGAWR